MLSTLQRFFETPKRILSLSTLAVLLTGAIAPAVIQKISADGGFKQYGWNIDLSTWPNIRADQRGLDGGINTSIRTIEGGIEHKEFWINTGQNVVFRKVPATISTEFTVLARVHPAWNRDAALGALTFRVTVRGTSGRTSVTEKIVAGEREISGSWQTLKVDLTAFAGEKVTIEVFPYSPQSGIWTLWRDPAIMVKR